MLDSELCQRCKLFPMTTTVSEGSREIPLCLNCLRILVDDALEIERKRLQRNERNAWHDVLKGV